MTLYERITTKPGYRLLLVLALAVTMMNLDFIWEEEQQKAAPVVVESRPQTAQEAKYEQFFRKHNSPAPKQMAQAVMKAKTPRKRLLASVAVVESNGNPAAKGKAGEKGAWQIIEREWGTVPPAHRPDLQADQATIILEQLIKDSNGNLRQALCRYNGDRSGAYSAKVMRKVAQL